MASPELNLSNDTAIVIYRHPKSHNLNLLSGNWKYLDKEEMPSDPYFIAHPFDENDSEGYTISIDKEFNIQDLKGLLQNIKPWLPGDPDNIVTADKELFVQQVEKGIESIKEGDFDKLVLSRMASLDLGQNFNLPDFLHELNESYPECFFYFLLIPNKVCWIGATPELLASIDQKGQFQTYALAGTLPLDQGESERKWTHKEYEEQEIVSSHIKQILETNNISQYQSLGPETISTGRLKHLKTTFKTHIKPDSQLFLSLVEQLHPTPAVSGLPQKESIEYLIGSEGYKRQLYAGYLGRIDENEESTLFVNLRCMQLFQNKAILYAGAGITIDSNPEKEYEETQRKMDALKRFIDATADSL